MPCHQVKAVIDVSFFLLYSHAFSIQGSTLTGARFPGADEKFIRATKFGILVAQISVKVVH